MRDDELRAVSARPLSARDGRLVRAFGVALAVDAGSVLGLGVIAALRRGRAPSRGIRWGDAAVALVGWIPAAVAFRGLVQDPLGSRVRAARLVDTGMVITVGGATVLAVVSALRAASAARGTTAESVFLLLGGAAISGVYRRILHAASAAPPPRHELGDAEAETV